MPKMSKESARSIPKIEPKLAGQHNYDEWISSVEMALTMYDIGAHTIWDIVIGECTTSPSIAASSEPSSSTTGKAPATTTATEQDWKKANYFAVLTMRKNCEPGALSKIGITKDANQAYKNLKAHYEGKTVTDLGVLLASIVKLGYDDRAHTIEEHIEEYEKKWEFMKTTLSTGEFTKKNFGKALKEISKDDDAKSEFLLMTMPSFYNTLVENLRTNSSYSYGDIVRQLQLYVPGRQKGRKAKGQEEGSKENPVVLKTEAKRDNGKRCDYCIAKGWKGLHHTESECFTKKREKKKASKVKGDNSDEESDTEGVTIKAIRIGKTRETRKERWMKPLDTEP